MKTNSNKKTINLLMIFLILLSSSVSNSFTNSDEISSINQKKNEFGNDLISEEDAMIVALLNYNGEVKKTFELKRPQGGVAYVIEIEDGKWSKLVLVEPDGNFNLIEKKEL